MIKNWREFITMMLLSIVVLGAAHVTADLAGNQSQNEVQSMNCGTISDEVMSLISMKCTMEAVNTKMGYLNEGEAIIYPFPISGGRNFIEYVLTGCDETTVPLSVLSPGNVSALRSVDCGIDFPIYIFKDCDPRDRNCQAVLADTSNGSNKYVGITNPPTGTRYYLMVYAQKGSGPYTLHARSYQCEDDAIELMTQLPEMVSMMSTETDTKAPISIQGSE